MMRSKSPDAYALIRELYVRTHGLLDVIFSIPAEMTTSRIQDMDGMVSLN